MQLSALLTYVHDELPEVPRLLAVRALSDAARDFCTRSTFWREHLPAVDLEAGVSVYAVPLTADQECVALHGSFLVGRQVTPLTAQEAQPLIALPRDPATPSALTLVNATDVQVFPEPIAAVADGIKLVASLRPSRTAVGIPDFLGNRFARELGAGAKKILCEMSAQPWAAKAAVLLGPSQTTFEGAVSKARSEIETAFSSANARVQLRRWV